MNWGDGIPHRLRTHGLYNYGARFQPVDPFTSSIAQVTRNLQNASHIESINDMSLPSRPGVSQPRIILQSRNDDGRLYSPPHDPRFEGEVSEKSSTSSRLGSFDNAGFRQREPSPRRRMHVHSSSSILSHEYAARFTNKATRWEDRPHWPRSPVTVDEHPQSSPVIMGVPADEARFPMQISCWEDVCDSAQAAGETIRSSLLFATDILPRQVYLHLLLRLPSFYFSRVSRIFTEADLTLEEIQEMALQVYTEDKSHLHYDIFETERDGHSGIPMLSPSYRRLKLSWEQFIDNLVREWKTLNVISVLLLSAIMTMFQIHGAAEDPITRYLAFWSLICALMSVLYGCSFIIRFSSMRKAYKAIEWAIEAQKMQSILWNVWVMLAMPTVWMTWSILAFIASIMSFMWRAQANIPPDFEFSVSPSTEFGFRIFICIVLGWGVVTGILVMGTFQRYGTQMDETWTCRVKGFIQSTDSNPIYRSIQQDQARFGPRTSSPRRVTTPGPTFYHSPRGDEVSSTINFSLPYQSGYSRRLQPYEGGSTTC